MLDIYTVLLILNDNNQNALLKMKRKVEPVLSLPVTHFILRFEVSFYFSFFSLNNLHVSVLRT